MKDNITLHDLAKMIDHSLLHPAVTDEEIASGCALSEKYRVAAVCIKPYAVPMVKDLLSDSDVRICPVIAFPHGNSATAIKVKEAETAVQAGGSEIDMVVNIGKVIGGGWNYVSSEIRAVNHAVTANHAILKVIFENDYLEDAHIIRLCEICSEHQVAYAKTSSGYGFVKQKNGMYDYRGATDAHIRLMKKHLAPAVRIKAAGRIRTLDDVLRVRNLGADRVGATATESIMDEAIKRGLR